MLEGKVVNVGYHFVTYIIITSLTTEFCPGREGPVLFGDEENGYVMSYLFKIRDAQARGEARFYAIMILMTDRVFLISCWPFLVRYFHLSLCVFGVLVSKFSMKHSSFRSMAINLQEKADMVFQREKEVRERVHPFANRRVTAPITQGIFAFWHSISTNTMADIQSRAILASKKQQCIS